MGPGERFTDSMRARHLFSWVVARLCLTPLSKPFFQRLSSLDLSHDMSCWLGKEMQPSSELFKKTWRPQELRSSAVEKNMFISENVPGDRPRRCPQWVDQAAVPERPTEVTTIRPNSKAPSWTVFTSCRPELSLFFALFLFFRSLSEAAALRKRRGI